MDSLNESVASARSYLDSNNPVTDKTSEELTRHTNNAGSPDYDPHGQQGQREYDSSKIKISSNTSSASPTNTSPNTSTTTSTTSSTKPSSTSPASTSSSSSSKTSSTVPTTTPSGSSTNNSSSASSDTPDVKASTPDLQSIYDRLKGTTNTSEYKSYQEIYDEYSNRLRSKTPELIEEYRAEAADNNNGIAGLAESCSDKIHVLANINAEGINKMASFFLSQSSGSYSEYDEWGNKLISVYMDEGTKIYDEYISSALK